MSGRKRLYFISICLAMFAANFANSAQGVLLSSYIDHYGLVSAEQGLMSTFQSAGCLAVCVAIMLLAGRIKRHHILIISCSLIFISMAVIGIAPPFFAVLAMYFLMGMGYASISNITSSLTSELYVSNRAAMCTLHLFYGIGGFLAPIALRVLLARTVWNIVCLAVSGAAFIALVFYCAVLKPARDITAGLKSGDAGITFGELKVFFSEKRNILLLVSAFGYMAYQNGVTVWIPRYFDIALSAAELGAITLSAFWVGNIVYRLISPRFGIRTEVLFSAGCILAAAFLGAGILLKSAPAMLVFMVLGGFTSGASVPQLYHLSCVWNDKNTLLATSVTAIALFSSFVITAPVTAALASVSIDMGMASVAVYVFIGGIAMLPMAVKRENKGVAGGM